MTDELEKAIREALKWDFNKLYVKEYTTTWELERISRGIELDIMGLTNILSLIEGEIEQGREKLDAVKVELAELNKKLDDREDDLIQAKKEERDRILDQMELERCDPTVMAWFEDYYWLPVDVWQSLKGG